jgi:hypothetical protein
VLRVLTSLIVVIFGVVLISVDIVNEFCKACQAQWAFVFPAYLLVKSLLSREERPTVGHLPASYVGLVTSQRSCVTSLDDLRVKRIRLVEALSGMHTVVRAQSPNPRNSGQLPADEV